MGDTSITDSTGISTEKTEDTGLSAEEIGNTGLSAEEMLDEAAEEFRHAQDYKKQFTSAGSLYGIECKCSLAAGEGKINYEDIRKRIDAQEVLVMYARRDFPMVARIYVGLPMGTVHVDRSTSTIHDPEYGGSTRVDCTSWTGLQGILERKDELLRLLETVGITDVTLGKSVEDNLCLYKIHTYEQ